MIPCLNPAAGVAYNKPAHEQTTWKPLNVYLSLFVFFSFLLFFFSRKALKNPEAHGFYRFFAFEGILAIVLLNHPYWFENPFAPLQILSWLLLLASIIFIVHALTLLKQQGGHAEREDMPENYVFENTTQVVNTGLYHYIRHPMYGSLLLLAWGAFFKHPTALTTIFVVAVSALLIITAKREEKENIVFFGDSYKGYIKQTTMFIPWLL